MLKQRCVSTVQTNFLLEVDLDEKSRGCPFAHEAQKHSHACPIKLGCDGLRMLLLDHVEHDLLQTSPTSSGTLNPRSVIRISQFNSQTLIARPTTVIL